jgi:uncharacterized protein YjiS (DUF1127 family)
VPKRRWLRQWSEGESEMEMHSRQSLYEIHGITVSRRHRRSGPIARRLIARIWASLTKVKRAIEAELAARRAIAELADMDDYMLRDIGITRSEIASRARRARADVETDDAPILSNDVSEHTGVWQAVDSPDIASEAQTEQEMRRLHLSGWG